MISPLSRTLYMVAAAAWLFLLWPNPITIFLAACLACLTLPIHRKLRKKAARWRKTIYKKNYPPRVKGTLLRLSNLMPISCYVCFLLFSFLIPLAILVSLVSPQAAAGLARLRQLRANNFQFPAEWVDYFHSLRETLSEYPRLEKLINEGLANLDSMFTDAVGMLVSRSFGFVGSTMSAVWLTFLFFTLAVLFTEHAPLLRKIAGRVLRAPVRLVSRFLIAIHKALKAIMLGIVLVALIQGALCGMGFAVAGVDQPAFWGMLAAMVAPIPTVGTALVWLPLSISLWFTGKQVAAVGLVIWGAIVVAGVDNVLRPLFLRQGIKASFFVLILAILCGLSVFGAVGLIAGPVLLAIAMQALEEANRYYHPAP